MASKPVKVLVVVPERTFVRDDGSTDTEKGVWCCKRFFPNGATEVILEDDPPGEEFQYVEFLTGQTKTDRSPGLTVAQKLRQLEEMQGGKIMRLSDGNKTREVKTPALLAFKILDGEIPGAPAAKPAEARAR
jgi:hypothetical protein